MRRLDDAVAASRRALERDPLSPFLQWRLGYRYHLTRHWELCIQQCRNALELDPHYVWAHYFLSTTYLHYGQFDEAIRAMEPVIQLTGRGPMAIGLLGLVHAMAGQISEARKCLVELRELARKTYVPGFAVSLIYGGLGEVDSMFDWLEKAVDEHEGLAIHLHVEPGCDPLRAHPRYAALLRKMNLAP